MGIVFLLYRISRLVVLAYVRNTLRHRVGAKRRAGTVRSLGSFI
ncbi:MAG: hypothetical protein AVDCRST_MAG58-2009 [uncultured Rubrobacteraceae bacterium]|uniref:Uncharacterized protein n=1 Tax=uncultured Rubrobacteraceae bacterium TaxID=349277 RepID=A0A6J4R6J5_9ACTN|nr:MAG: hypothetical protein AVDCRST_MAG58-2009 [uncultured Rubrobacteraceae bacterium]